MKKIALLMMLMLLVPAMTAEPVIGARFLAEDGQVHVIGGGDTTTSVVMLYFNPDCSLSPRYVRGLKKWVGELQDQGEQVYGVVISNDNHWPVTQQFGGQYGFTFPLLADPSGDLRSRVTLTHLPSVFSYDVEGNLRYGGRADDAFQPRLIDAPKNCSLPQYNPVSPTYYRDIQPIIAANCVECHQAGGIAPFSLESYQIVRAFAERIRQVTGDRTMPPWQASILPGKFRNERVLSHRQLQLLSQWAMMGALSGREEEAPPATPSSDSTWRLGEPDLVLTMPQPFQIYGEGEDIYRYFVLPSQLIEDKTVIGIDFRPGDASVVHHANFFADYSGRARREAAKDDLPGFSVFGKGSFMSYDGDDQDNFGIGGWAPGAEPYQTPSDAGIWLRQGADIVIEIHYHPSGRTTQDKSSIAFYFDEEETKSYLDGLLIGTQDLDIPEGEDNYRRHFYMDVPTGFMLVDVMPHMHYIGKSAEVVLTLPDGSRQDIVRVDDWQLAWQRIYAFRKPLYVPAGSRIEAWFSYDNSRQNPQNPHRPPKRVRWGWNTTDEMAEVWMGIIPDDWEMRNQLVKASQDSWYRDASP